MQEVLWDVVVIGAGMSGLGAGLRLALAGKKVLIVDDDSNIWRSSFYRRAAQCNRWVEQFLFEGWY